MEHIETIPVGAAGAASIEFLAIPQTYTDLYILASARTNRASAEGDDFKITMNNVTTSVYDSRRLYGTGSVAGSDTGGTVGYIYGGVAGAASQSSHTFGNSSFYFPNYTSSLIKLVSLDGVSENNSTTAFLSLAGGKTTEVAPIESIQIAPLTGPVFVQFSTFSLYGILAGSDGIVAVS